ncbi:MAG: AsmA family protein [Candidatus Omnitrophica bacterium]|nr:AsmA family protein [Candidatus Omnitrophota bacterium]
MKIIRRFIIFLGVVFLTLLILLVILFAIVKHFKIKEIVEKEIEHSLGIQVTIKKIEFSPLLAHIAAKGITIHNPKGFTEDELAYLSSIHFVFDPVEILTRKKPNVYVFALELDRLNIIKNKDGRVNIKEILPVMQTDTPKDQEAPFYFDMLVLSIGEVNYVDYSGEAKKEHKYPIGIKNATFIGLNEDKVIKMIVYKAIENTDIGKLINLKIIPVVSQIKDTADSAWGAAKSGAKSAWAIATLPFNLAFGNNL